MARYKTNYKDGYSPAFVPAGMAYDSATKEYYDVDANGNEVGATQGSSTNPNSATNSGYSANSYQSNPQIATLTSQYLSRSPFTFDYEKDPLYQNYLAQYTREGQNAMQNTLAQISARTGGLASSYAGQAAQGTYDEYMKQAADKIPDIYQLRYNEWLNQGDELRNQISLLQNQDDTAYSRYRDTVGDERYADETAYNRGRDALNDKRYDDETAYNRDQDAKNWDWKQKEYDYQVSQDKISNYYKNLSAKQTEKENNLQAAQIQASAGNLKPLANYYGVSEDTLYKYLTNNDSAKPMSEDAFTSGWVEDENTHNQYLEYLDNFYGNSYLDYNKQTTAQAQADANTVADERKTTISKAMDDAYKTATEKGFTDEKLFNYVMSAGVSAGASEDEIYEILKSLGVGQN